VPGTSGTLWVQFNQLIEFVGLAYEVEQKAQIIPHKHKMGPLDIMVQLNRQKLGERMFKKEGFAFERLEFGDATRKEKNEGS
jgi:hypothetical protein